METPKKFLSCQEVSQELGIPLGVIYQYIRNHEIPATKLGRHYIIARKYLEDLEAKALGR